MLAMRQPAEARGLYEEILDLYVDLRSPEGQADTLLGMANSQLLDCRWDAADALYQEARYRYEEMGQSDKALACQINLGVLRGKRGDLPGGRTLLLQALNRCAQLGEEQRAASVLLGLAMIETRMGEYRTARRRLLAVLRGARRSGTRRNRALAFEYFGNILFHQGRWQRAAACLQAGYEIAHEIAPGGDICFEIRRLQSEIALARRSPIEARILAAESQALARSFGDEYEAAIADRVLAEVEAAEGEVQGAMRRAQAARQVLGRLGETYERARIDLLLLRLELLSAGLPAGRIREKVEEACRQFSEMPEAPVVREAHWLLAGTGWNVSAAARSLGVSRSTLRRSLASLPWLYPTAGTS
jgi:tetratricopeptide (TPR) repeat protein